MGYTYDDFVNAANKAGVMNRFSDNDLSTAKKNPEYGMSMVGLMKDVSNAKTEEQRLLATEAANQMRKNYGVYNTGNTASDYSYASSYGSTINDLLGQIKDYGSFNYENQEQYQKLLDQVTGYGEYSYANQEEYQKLLDSIVNQQAFSYDLQSDPSWSSYKKAYLREGDRASANALAQASAASGGRPSSYAVSAAQQAGNYYAGQLSDIIPTLEQNAYSRYLSDFNNRLSSLSALESDRSFDYQDYLNRFSQLQTGLGALETDRAFNYENWMNEYNMLQNSLGNYQGQDATDYQRYLDAYNRQYQAEQNQLAQEQQKYENEQTAKQLAYENAMALYQTMGYATEEVAKILGIPAGTRVAGKSSSGSSSSKSSTKSSETTLNATKDTGGSNKMTIDKDSVLALGYGPISESKLNELVAAGEIKEVIDGNVIRFVKVTKPSYSGTSFLPKTQATNTMFGK